MHAVFAAILALMERDQFGGGRLVETAMVEAVLNAAAEQVVEFSAAGRTLGRDGNRGPVAAPQGVYPCAGVDEWIAVAVVTDDHWRALGTLLDDQPWAGDSLDSVAGRRAGHDDIDRALSAWTAPRRATDLLELLLGAGVPAAIVTPPREIARNPQLQARRLFEVEHHEVTGSHEIPTLPFRFSRVEHWLRGPAPTLGRDNDQVLAELGYSPADIGRLRQAGIVGEEPAGV
jgi:crotonobetainyl-CoA:carnitine CoA-transferase CaiB-like acyl-CoA transferase